MSLYDEIFFISALLLFGSVYIRCNSTDELSNSKSDDFTTPKSATTVDALHERFLKSAERMTKLVDEQLYKLLDETLDKPTRFILLRPIIRNAYYEIAKLQYETGKMKELNTTYMIVCRFARFLACGGTIRAFVEYMPMECLVNVDSSMNRQREVLNILKTECNDKKTFLTNVIKTLGSYVGKFQDDADRKNFGEIMARLKNKELKFENSQGENIPLRESLKKLVQSNDTETAFNLWYVDKDTVWCNYNAISELSPLDDSMVTNITRTLSRMEIINILPSKRKIEPNEYDYAHDVVENGYLISGKSNPEKHYLRCIWVMYTEYNGDERIKAIFDKLEKEWTPRYRLRSQVLHKYCKTMQKLFVFLSLVDRHKPSEFSAVPECNPQSEDFQIFLEYVKHNDSDMAYVTQTIMLFKDAKCGDESKGNGQEGTYQEKGTDQEKGTYQEKGTDQEEIEQDENQQNIQLPSINKTHTNDSNL